MEIPSCKEDPMNTAKKSSDQPCGDCLVFTVTEAANLLGISRAFAYELVARGEILVIRLGRRRLVPRLALLDLVGQGSEDDAGAVS
jgi:excisionase family DNA binding protein